MLKEIQTFWICENCARKNFNQSISCVHCGSFGLSGKPLNDLETIEQAPPETRFPDSNSKDLIRETILEIREQQTKKAGRYLQISFAGLIIIFLCFCASLLLYVTKSNKNRIFVPKVPAAALEKANPPIPFSEAVLKYEVLQFVSEELKLYAKANENKKYEIFEITIDDDQAATVDVKVTRAEKNKFVVEQLWRYKLKKTYFGENNLPQTPFWYIEQKDIRKVLTETE